MCTVVYIWRNVINGPFCNLSARKPAGAGRHLRLHDLLNVTVYPLNVTVYPLNVTVYLRLHDRLVERPLVPPRRRLGGSGQTMALVVTPKALGWSVQRSAGWLAGWPAGWLLQHGGAGKLSQLEGKLSPAARR